MPAGRPRVYDRDEVMGIICGCIAQGKSLYQILAANDQLPSYTEINRWLAEDEKLRLQYVRAREDQADYLADEIVMIADTEPDPQVARVRVDARKWVASKLKAKKYGDRIYQEHSGTVNVATLTDEELLALVAGQGES